MVATTAARLGSRWGWTLGEDNWKSGMDFNLLMYDTVVGLVFLDDTLVTPVGLTPADGDTYLVATSATGAWTGYDHQIAAYQHGQWNFYTFPKGLRAWFVNHSKFRWYDGTAWVDEPSGASTWNGGTVAALGAHLAITGGTLDVTGITSGGTGTVTQIVAGVGLNGGTIAGAGTIDVNTSVVATRSYADAGDAANASSIASLLTGINTNTTAIAANLGSITVLGSSVAANTTAITANAGSITALGSTVAANTTSITALGSTVAANTTAIATKGTGTVTNVVAGAGLSGGPITNTGTFIANWQAATVVALGANLTNTGGTLSVTGTISGSVSVGAHSILGNPGTATATGGDVTIGTNLTLTSAGTLDVNTGVVALRSYVDAQVATKGTGSVTQIIAGLGLNGGTVVGSGTLTVDTSVIATRTYADAGDAANAGAITSLAGTVASNTSAIATKGTGSVASVVAGAGLSGGTISNTGTVSLSAIAATSLMGNAAGSSAVPGALSIGAGLSLASGGTLSVNGLTYAMLPAEVQSFPVVVPFSGKPDAAASIPIPIVQDTTIPANFTGAVGYAGTAGTAAKDFVVTYNHSGTVTTHGTITFGIGATIATFSTQAAHVLVAGDTLLIATPGTQDATLSNVGIALKLLKA